MENFKSIICILFNIGFNFAGWWLAITLGLPGDAISLVIAGLVIAVISECLYLLIAIVLFDDGEEVY